MKKILSCLILILSLFLLFGCAKDDSFVNLIGNIFYIIEVDEDTQVTIIEPRLNDDYSKSFNVKFKEGYNELINFYKNKKEDMDNVIIIYYNLDTKLTEAIYNKDKFKKEFVDNLVTKISNIEMKLEDDFNKNLNIYKQNIIKYFK